MLFKLVCLMHFSLRFPLNRIWVVQIFLYDTKMSFKKCLCSDSAHRTKKVNSHFQCQQANSALHRRALPHISQYACRQLYRHGWHFLSARENSNLYYTSCLCLLRSNLIMFPRLQFQSVPVLGSRHTSLHLSFWRDFP